MQYTNVTTLNHLHYSVFIPPSVLEVCQYRKWHLLAFTQESLYSCYLLA